VGRPPVLNKPDYTRRARRGEFGNVLGSWPSIDAAEADGFCGPTFWVRGRDKQWPHTEMYLPWARRREEMARKVTESGTPEADILVCEDEPPGSRRVLQGHVWWPRSDQFVLAYDESQATLRAAEEAGLTTVVGLAARDYLERRLDPCDHEHLLQLLTDYPDHVVEFTSFSQPLGLLHRCIIIWEVRKY
jgi:hypothetical protein